MTVNLRDKGLWTALESIRSDARVTRADVEQLLDATAAQPALSETERADLEQLLAKVGDRFEPDARATLQAFLAVESRGPALADRAAPEGALRAHDVELQAKATPVERASRSGAPWWEGVDASALGGALHPEPLAESTEVGEVSFSQQDLLGLLRLLGDSPAASLVDLGHLQALYERALTSES